MYKIINNKAENEKKLIKVRLYGEKLRTVIAPSKNGKKNIIKNLLLSREGNLIPFLLV